MKIVKPGKLSPPADLRRDEFDTDNEFIINSGEHVNIVFIGDSITEGWNVKEAFKNIGNTVNRGISGDVIDIIEKRFEADALQLHPDIVVIHGGVNNTFPFFETKSEDMPETIEKAINLFTESYKKIFNTCKEANQMVIGCAVTPLAEQPSIGATARKETIIRFNAVLQALCKEYGYPYADYHTALAEFDGKTVQPCITYDGLHPNDSGYGRMDNVIRPILTAYFSGKNK